MTFYGLCYERPRISYCSPLFDSNQGQDTLLDKILNIQHRLNPLHVYCRLIERGMNKRFSLSICRYYEILIYSWLAWFAIVAVRICKLTHGRIIIKMLLVFSCAVTLFLGVAGIAKAIPIDFTHVWYPTASWSESNESYTSR